MAKPDPDPALANEDDPEVIIGVDNFQQALDEAFKEMDLGFHCAQALAFLATQTTSLETQKKDVSKMFSNVESTLVRVKKEMEEARVDDEIRRANEVVKEIADDDDDDVQYLPTSIPTLQPGAGRRLSEGPESPRTVWLRRVENWRHLWEILIHTVKAQPPPKFNLQRGPVKRPELYSGCKVFAKKNNDVWHKGTVHEMGMGMTREKQFRVKFDSKLGSNSKWVDSKHIAYACSPDCVLPVGTRIIARYTDDLAAANAAAASAVATAAQQREDVGEERRGAGGCAQYYAGVMAEPPNPRNGYTYLVFFDDGYAQYCRLEEIHVVFSTSRNVWDDVYVDSRDFIRDYLQQYPERPMVRLTKGQSIKVEWNASWWSAKVIEVNASLVKMYFEADKRTEWIYRGSTRLEPLYRELMNANRTQQGTNKTARRHLTVQKNKRPAPFVEYTRGDSFNGNQEAAKQKQAAVAQPGMSEPGQKKKMTARKSTAGKKPADVEREGPRILYEPAGHFTQQQFDGSEGQRFTQKMRQQPGTRSRYFAHACRPSCITKVDDDPEKYKNKNPFTIPLLFGWERQIAKKHPGPKQFVFYRAPCARRLRTITEVQRYLTVVNSKLTIDLFCYDPYLDPYGYFVPKKSFCDIKDISYGKENVPIPCVNGVDREYPDYIEYSQHRIPTRGVNLNLDPAFLCGCDCEDDCQDREKCACVQLTVTASKANGGGEANPDAGYHDRRLKEAVITGVYECNSTCKCSKKCHNRVVQNGLSLRLQVFKTDRKGWGLRCLNDIPAGTFICCYAGQLLTEQGANEVRVCLLCEYEDLLTLEGIFQPLKALPQMLPSNLETQEPSEGLRDFAASDPRQASRSYCSTPLKIKGCRRWMVTARDANAQTNNGKEEKKRTRYKPLRSWYNEEYCFVMDAKSQGNLGRYLNHSCSPNVFVQNVFVDTHDLRFPWVAFFSDKLIRAGGELTWDYSYEIGSVPGKVLYCYCQSQDCRGRLL
ncbi:PREDICTED: histone-lysine N-methyltransferase SETDB1-like [Priapulus caudatus]|uniref:Histone-lysine N-methyltransferase SETDB1-like n=1 Tax=Priapulus caudatus TaxID=37621 RepID=A0ABM1EPS9_PRICU|nr:PREDICTED: histone-lysine N-methyltransferase SETDB1-like [Priapulus caudatus]